MPEARAGKDEASTASRQGSRRTSALRAAARRAVGGRGSSAATPRPGVTGGTGSPPAKKATAKKATAKKATAKKATAKKTTASSETSAKKASAAKTAAKKTGAQKAVVENPVTQTAAKKATSKQAPAKKTTAKKAPVSRGRRVALPVREGEAPWSEAELAEVRSELASDRDRLLAEVSAAEHDIQVLLRDGGDGAGNDQADVGSNALERDAEISLAKNSREMLFQVDRALARLDDGTYGVCESCGQPIGKLRLMAFPRATLCVPCKQRQERR